MRKKNANFIAIGVDPNGAKEFESDPSLIVRFS